MRETGAGIVEYSNTCGEGLSCKTGRTKEFTGRVEYAGMHKEKHLVSELK
jgi:hypothetical protein